jgi:hypothetical protein
MRLATTTPGSWMTMVTDLVVVAAEEPIGGSPLTAACFRSLAGLTHAQSASGQPGRLS